MSERERLLAADRAARRLAQTEFARPLVLEAGAGTGKTTTLVARLLAWTLGPGWEHARTRASERSRAAAIGRGADPRDDADDERVAAEVLRGVVAITFTEAAAAEMAHRAARGLADVARHLGQVPDWLAEAALPPPAERARRARALLATLDHLSVSTIHAFCRRLLAEHPLEAGVHPQLEVDADGRILEEVVAETVESGLREGYGEPGDPHLLALAERGLGPREIVEALLVLAREGVPAAALADDPFGGASAAALVERLRSAARALAAELVAHPPKKAPNAEKIVAALGALLDRLTAPAPLARLGEDLAALLPDNLVGHLGNWEKQKFNQAEAASFGAGAADIGAAAAGFRRVARFVAGLDLDLATAARQALRPLLERIETALHARGAATFQSLLDGAARLLEAHPAVRREVRRGIDQLLVDEFQDTDRLQCRLLGALALDDPAADHRPGLFLVGDPKQSIYGWRSADLASYAGFVGRVRAAGGEVLPLAENFRSVPPILDEVARAIAPVMRAREGLQPPFEALLPSVANEESAGFVEAGRRPVEHWVLWRREEPGAPGLGKTPPTAALELEAAAVARDLAEIRAAAGTPWRRFGILLRGFGAVDVVLDALRRARVPFAVGRDRQYYRRREVIEAAALARMVLDPGDHIALLTFLRSSAVGVPDVALVPLWARGLPRLASELGGSPRALAAAREAIRGAAKATPREVPGLAAVALWPASLEAALEAVAALRRSFATEPTDRFVERLRRASLVEAMEAARYQGGYRLANLDRFFRRLLDTLEEGDASALLRVLRRSVALGLDAEEARPEASEDAVAVMTIHGAKGLDFDHVYLLQTHRPPRPDREGETLVGRVDDRFEMRLFGAPTPGFSEVEEARREVEAAERVRTLYVALTRAKVRLVVSGLPDGRAAEVAIERARSHLDLLGRRDGSPNLASLFAELEGRGESSRQTADGVLWRFPALAPQIAADDGTERAVEATIGLAPAEVAAAARDLAKRRTAARRRQSRPTSAPASEEAHERLRELLEREASRDGAETGTAGPGDRRAALAAGTAVHRALELWDLAAEPAGELERAGATVAATVRSLAGPAAPAAERRARDLLTRFAAGPLLPRLAALRERIVARELPVLLPPEDRDGGPVGFVSGAIDLLLREREGEFVIVDWKTDEVDDADLPARAAAYAPQGAIYARAVREALGLDRDPRFELWFLALGRVVEPSPAK